MLRRDEILKFLSLVRIIPITCKICTYFVRFLYNFINEPAHDSMVLTIVSHRRPAKAQAYEVWKWMKGRV